MDTVEDTELAIGSFRMAAACEDPGHRYLAVYGLLQALSVQQDAVQHLHEALGQTWASREDTDVRRIRHARNCSIGHPTKQGPARAPSHFFIIQISMIADSFDLLSRDAYGNTHAETVQLSKFINTQSRIVADSLSLLHDHLEAIDRQYRMKFKDTPLSAAFDGQYHYAFEKLVGATCSDGTPLQIGQWGLTQIKKCLERFEHLLKERGLGISTYPGVEGTWSELEYPLVRLDEFLHGGSAIEPQAAYIFARFLQSEVEELRQMAREIDQEYSGRDHTGAE